MNELNSKGDSYYNFTYKPDRVIVRKIKEYDQHLYFRWNARREFFELWRRMVHGNRRITPITQSIYDPSKPIKFAEVDERLLWWLWDADSQRQGTTRDVSLELDSRYKEWLSYRSQKQREYIREFAKDSWHRLANFYGTKYASKNKKTPTQKRPQQQFVRPDLKSNTSKHLMYRSAANAKRYNYKPWPR